MRVIAGRLRGLRLDAPPSPGVRPTYDRVRESLFAVIEPRLQDASVLDLFAGSGSLAIESLSRGAAHATLVEIDRAVGRVAAGNVERLGVESKCSLVRGDALRLLRGRLPGAPFDVVFVDPPYESDLQGSVLSHLGTWDGLAGDALVVVERSTDRPLAGAYGRLERRRTMTYGTTEVDLYGRTDAEPGHEGRDDRRGA
jgi:16S rRNA (guanine966-N2)-methyltransferase